ncbi:sensor histidine kinase [Variovorax saccharolyticus]|uniref:sensor histidine kinase n=1 Tax=Variovorax saccharolyticus TaxID=3053516 RepID=UPI002576A080|nr:sensor histidine kinase [Variovorax sp. J31P216]MDM0028163.1 sensor histidine kinase N-terminal domain-containing protein [Variovorax sp. J31P216]
MSSGAAAAPSLTARVLRRVLLPLGLTWLLGTAVAVVVASYFTEQAFDRAMIDDAHTVSANVRASERGVEILLSPREIEALLYDPAETVFFAVRRPDGSLLAGDPGLEVPMPEEGAHHRFSRIEHQGHTLRAVALNQGTPLAYRVVVAQTTRARVLLVEQLLAYSLAPQLVLLALLAAWLWRGIRRELHPLGELRRTLETRDAQDLAAVPVARSSRELEQLGDTLNALLQRLAQSAAAQREFAGNVAHELRTPLAGIRALADYGLSQQDPAVWREQLQQIAMSQARASRLVDQLLGLALADEARTRLQRESLRLDQLAQQAVLRHLARADRQGVDLGGSGLEDEALVQGNAALIEGILDNLIDNALRYGGRTITVELAGLTLSVVDDGPGIAPDAQPGLLQRWAQGPAGQKLGQGAGLGLAIVARYATLLGAELRFAPASAAGGLRVSVTFAPDAQASAG